MPRLLCQPCSVAPRGLSPGILAPSKRSSLALGWFPFTHWPRRSVRSLFLRRVFSPPMASSSSDLPLSGDSNFGLVSTSDVSEITEDMHMENRLLNEEAELEVECDETTASRSQEVESVECKPRQTKSSTAEVKSVELAFQRQNFDNSGNEMIDVLPEDSDFEPRCKKKSLVGRVVLEATGDGQGSSQDIISYKILNPGSNSNVHTITDRDKSRDNAEVTANVTTPGLDMAYSEENSQEHSTGESAVQLSSSSSDSFLRFQGDNSLDSSADVLLSKVRQDREGHIKEESITDLDVDGHTHDAEVIHELPLLTAEPLHDKEPSTEAIDISSSKKDHETDIQKCATDSVVVDGGAHAMNVAPEFPVLTEESIHSEEPSPQAMDVVGPVSTESLKLDGKVASSNLEEKVSKADASLSQASELQIGDTYNDREKILTTELVLCSGTASIAHPSKAFAGGQDFYFVTPNWIGIADGAWEWSFGGTVVGLYAKELIENCEKIVSDNTIEQLTGPVAVLCKAAARSESSGLCTILVAYFDGQVLCVANIGNSGVLILRNGIVCERCSLMVHEFNFPLQLARGDDPSKLLEEYRFDLEEGDIIITATDGLFDNLYEQELVSIVTKSLKTSSKPQEIAQKLAERAHELGRMASVRSPFADAAHAAGYVGFTGGKLDDVTVVVSLVQSTSSSVL